MWTFCLQIFYYYRSLGPSELKSEKNYCAEQIRIFNFWQCINRLSWFQKRKLEATSQQGSQCRLSPDKRSRRSPPAHQRTETTQTLDIFQLGETLVFTLYTTFLMLGMKLLIVLAQLNFTPYPIRRTDSHDTEVSTICLFDPKLLGSNCLSRWREQIAETRC